MSEEFATSDAIAKAKEWLDVATPRWRLQTLQHRGRYNPKTGEYRQLPTRIRRFLNGTPAGMKAAVLQVLKESAPYKAPVFDLECDGCLYMPTNTFIRKDGVEHAANQRDATYTIIQDLRLFDDLGDRFSFPDASACSEFGETEYFWDEFEVGDCPDGSQGISYQITDVSRDRETDLFSYRLRKVTALTQHMPPVVSQCDARKRVTVETWNNVYGEPGSFRWDPAKGGSAPIRLPAPCSSADGVDVKVSVAENADCTYRIELVTTEAKVDEGLFSVYRDQYKVQESGRTFNAMSPLPKSGVEYSGGVTTKYTSERNEDGSWNNTVDKETERHVPSSAVEVRVMPRSTTTTRVDTNAPSPASSLPAGAEFGSYKSTKTPGGLFTNEYVSFARTLFGNLGLVCSDTAFLKTHETQATADSVPDGVHVPPAGGGLVTTWNYDTDAEGIVVRRERTEREHEVRSAVRRRTMGWLGTTSGYVHRSVSGAEADSLLSSAGLGMTVEAKMTNGRLWDVEVQSFVRVVGRSLGLDCQKTVYQHVHEVAVSADAVGDEASDAGGGRTYRRSFRLDAATGAVTQTDTTTYELPVEESRRSVRVTARGRTVRTVSANSPSRPADAAAVGETTEFEVTPGGRFNVTRETTVPRAGDVAGECSDDAFLHTDASARTQSAKAADHVAPAGGGKYRERVQRLGDDGLWEVRDVEHSEREVPGGVEVSVTARGRRRTVVTQQTGREGTEPGVNDAGKALRRTKTKGGLNNLEETTFEPRTQDSGRACEHDHFLHSDAETALRKAPTKGDLPRGGGGEYRERTARLGDDGLWEETTVTHREEEVTGEVDVSVTARGRRRTTIKRQTSDTGKEPGVNDAGKSLRRTKTRGGLNNLEETEFEPRTQANGHACENDKFLHSHSKTELVKSPATGDLPQGAGGEYKERTARLGDDGLWEETTVEHREHEVTGEVDVSVTARGRRKTTITRQTSNEGKEPGVNDAGKSLRRTKTRGGLNNIEETTFEPRTQDSGRTCEHDHFLHSDARTELKKAPTKGDLPRGGGGEYRERTARLGDDGLWEETLVEHKEHEVTGEVDIAVTARGRRKTTITRQTSNAGEEPGVNDAGKSLRRTKTRGGLNNLEETEFEPRKGKSAIECSRDLFQETDATTELHDKEQDKHVKDEPDRSGVYHERRQRLGDDGLWEVTDTDHKEKAVEGQRVEVRVTKLGKVKRTTDVQVESESSHPEPQAVQGDVGKERTVEKTRGKRRNVTYVEVTPITGEVEKRCEKDAFLHSTTTVEGKAQAPSGSYHVDNAANGKYHEKTMRLNDLGVWEETLAEHEEEQPHWSSREYEDAFGATRVDEDRSHSSEAGPEGAEFDAERLIRHVESELTRGKRYNVRTVTETPTEVDSGWIHFEKETSNGLGVYYDFIVFRNARMDQVGEWIQHLQDIDYTGGDGSFANHPSISISPNKFKLWDGSVMLTTTFTPKAWASGGSTRDDNYGPIAYQVKDVSVSPMNAVAKEGGEGQLFLLKAVTTEDHKRGGGVGKDKLDAVLADGALVRGSVWSYHPSGQSFQYDIITRRSVVYHIVRATAGVSTS